MGTAHNPKSTRARRERSDRTSPKTSRKPSGTAAVDSIRTTNDDAPAAALQRIQDRLELIRSSVIVVAHALMAQNCELDDDAARVLRHHVTDALTEQVAQLGLLLPGGAS